LGTATSIQHEVSAASGDALARCAAIIAREPDLAERLAAILTVDHLITVLSGLAQQRGIALDESARQTLSSGHMVTFANRVAEWALESRRGWQPFALEWGPAGAELVWGNGVARAEAAFHEETVGALRSLPMNRLFAVRTPLTREFVAALEADALPIRGLIFHMSRCGSTLIAQALKAWPGVRVLSEPGPLDTAITAACTGIDPDWLIFRGVIAALAQPAGGDRDVVIKLDAWHALVLPQIRQSIPVPWLFAYRNPIEVLVSHVREPGRHTVPGMLPSAWFGAPEPIHDVQTRVQYAARVLGAICAAVVPYADAANLVNYDQLPQALTTCMPLGFGLDPAAADHASLIALLKKHAKRPYESFADDRAAKRGAAGEEVRAAAERWMALHYATLEKIRNESAA
jgi:hypothetical protein